MGNGNVIGISTPLIPRQRGTIRVHAYWQVISGCVASGQRSNTFSVVWMAWAVETSCQDVSTGVCALHRCESIDERGNACPPLAGGVGGWNGTSENYCKFTACIHKIKSAE